MDLGSLRNDSLVIQWFENINATKHTQLSYLQAIKQFTDHTKHTPDELITEAEQEIQAGLLTRQRKLKGYFIGFRKILKDNELADMTIQARIAAIKSFYESFDIPIPKLKGERRKAIPKECNCKLPSKEDLRECLKCSDMLEKCMMLTGLSGGLASNEIRNIKLKQFLDGYDKDTGITTLHVTRQKTQTRYITYLSPECSAAVWDYLKWRDRDTKAAGHKRQNQLAKQKTTENSYLFIVRGVPNAYLKTGNEELRKLSENAVLKMYKSISERASKNAEFGTYSSIRSHTMRKVFGSALTNNGCSEQVKEFLLGHTLDNTTTAYWFADPAKLKEQYKKYIPFLTIEKSLDISTSPEFKSAVEERDYYKALAQKYYVDGLELIDAKLTALKIKEMSPEQQREEFKKSLLQMQPMKIPELKHNATPEEKEAYEKMVAKEKENNEKMIKARDTVLKLLKSQESL